MTKVKMGLSGLSPAELVTKTVNLEEKLNGNASFATPVPALADIAAARVELQTWIQSAQWGDKRSVGQRIVYFNELTALLRTLANYVTLTAGVNRDTILSSGFDVRKTPESTSGLNQPVDFSAKRSEKSGEIVLKWRPVSNGRAYQIEYKTSDPALADSGPWTVALTSSKSNCTVTNLMEGTKYFFRVMAVNGAITSAYSDVALVMAA